MSKKQIGVNQGLKLFFGIFMVLVYLGMAILMAINFCNFANTPLWTAVRWLFVVVLALYGIYRAYREVTGVHTYGMRVEEQPEEEYKTYAERLKDLGQIPENDEKNL